VRLWVMSIAIGTVESTVPTSEGFLTDEWAAAGRYRRATGGAVGFGDRIARSVLGRRVDSRYRFWSWTNG